jgi:DJ-1 family protein
VIVIDVLRRAGVAVTVGGLQSQAIVQCARETKIEPDFALNQLDYEFDLVVLPGGMQGARAFEASKDIAKLLQHFNEQLKLIGVICASCVSLKAAGIVGIRITSHPCVYEELKDHYDYQTDNVVVDRNIVTSRGPGTAFEFAFELVRILCGQQVLEQVKKPMMF